MTGRRRGGGLGAWLRRRRNRRDDLATVCRDLQLDGWERLPADRGAIIVTAGDATAPTADWHLIARVIHAWAGPLHLLDPQRPTAAPGLATLAPEGPVAPSRAGELLAAGEKILVLSHAEDDAVDLPFDLPESTPVLHASLGPGDGGRRRLSLRPPGRSA